MPVIEVVLAAVGLSVGGERAWRKFRGLPEEDEATGESEPAPASADSAAPASRPPSFSDRAGAGIKDATGADGQALHPFFSDAIALVSPRKRHPDPPESPRGASPGWQGHLSPRWSTGWAGGADSGDTAGEDAALDSGALPWIRRVLGVQGGGLASPNGGAHGEQTVSGGMGRMRQAIRSLAGDNQRSSRSPPVRANEDLGADWDPLRTPRSSALKKSAFGADSPMQSPRFTPGGRRRVRFDRKNMTSIVYIHEDAAELESRRKRWALILQAAEREAFEAYVSAGKHRSRSDDEVSPREEARSNLFEEHDDTSASSNWLNGASNQGGGGSMFGFMGGGGGGGGAGSQESGRQQTRNWLSMPVEYEYDVGAFASDLSGPHSPPTADSNRSAAHTANNRREGGGGGGARPDGASPCGDASPRGYERGPRQAATPGDTSPRSPRQASASQGFVTDGYGNSDGRRSPRDRQPELEKHAKLEQDSPVSPRDNSGSGSPQTGGSPRSAKPVVPKLNLASAGLAGGSGGLSPRSPRGDKDRGRGAAATANARAYG